MGDSTSPMGGFLSGFTNGFSNVRDRKTMLANQEREQANREADRALAYAQINAGGGGGYGGGAEGANGRASGRQGSVAPFRSSDPTNTSLTPQQRAFLNSVAAGESAGAYNIRYAPGGGQSFDLAGGHPRIYEPGPHGKSSAAGRYQFTWSTWKDIAGAETPFTPENQDAYAWKLAEQRYRALTGEDLNATLERDGMTDSVMQTLAPTWQAFAQPSARGRYAATYADSLARYSAPSTPAQAPTTPQARSLPPADQFPLGQPA